MALQLDDEAPACDDRLSPVEGTSVPSFEDSACADEPSPKSDHAPVSGDGAAFASVDGLRWTNGAPVDAHEDQSKSVGEFDEPDRAPVEPDDGRRRMNEPPAPTDGVLVAFDVRRLLSYPVPRGIDAPALGSDTNCSGCNVGGRATDRGRADQDDDRSHLEEATRVPNEPASGSNDDSVEYQEA